MPRFVPHHVPQWGTWGTCFIVPHFSYIVIYIFSTPDPLKTYWKSWYVISPCYFTMLWYKRLILTQNCKPWTKQVNSQPWTFSEFSYLFNLGHTIRFQMCPALCPIMCPNGVHGAHVLLCPTFHILWYIFSQPLTP